MTNHSVLSPNREQLRQGHDEDPSGQRVGAAAPESAPCLLGPEQLHQAVHPGIPGIPGKPGSDGKPGTPGTKGEQGTMDAGNARGSLPKALSPTSQVSGPP